MSYYGISPLIKEIFWTHPVGFKMTQYDDNLRTFIKNKQNISLYSEFVSTLDSLIFQIVYGLAIAQQNRILHRDVKPNNILVFDKYKNNNTHQKNTPYNLFSCSGYEICLTDWGLSKIVVNDTSCMYDREVQTICYRSPEHLFDIKNLENNKTIDMWSVGVVMLELLILKEKELFPLHDISLMINEIVNWIGFPIENEYINHKKIVELKEKYPNIGNNTNFIENILLKCEETYCVELPPFCKSFIESCLKWSPNDRIDPVSALQHPFLNGFLKKHKNIYDISFFNQKIITNDLLTLMKLDSFEGVSVEKINELNPNYLIEKNSGRSLYIDFYKKFKNFYSDQLFFMCLAYTDKLMETVYFKSIFDQNLGAAIVSIIHGVTKDEPIYKSHMCVISPNYHFNNDSICEFMNLIIKTFKCCFPLKTLVTYVECMPDSAKLKDFFKNIAFDLVTSNSFLNMTCEELFDMSLEIMSKYNLIIENEKFYFDHKINKIRILFNNYLQLINNPNFETFEFSTLHEYYLVNPIERNFSIEFKTNIKIDNVVFCLI